MDNSNHIYIGGEDILPKWAKNNLPQEAADENEAEGNEQNSDKDCVARIRELIKNYLQLDNVNFLFGTGSSIHLGAASIQSIPENVEKAALNIDKPLFVNSLKELQKSLRGSLKKVEKKGKGGKELYKATNDWTYTIDENDLVRDVTLNAAGAIESIDSIAFQLEKLLDYLIAKSYISSVTDKNSKYDKLIDCIKKSMFELCDVDIRKTPIKDMERIKEKGYENLFNEDKYIFHEKFIKSLLQRSLNLKRANIFTSNYDLAFEYAFDKLGIQYIDGFAGFHNRTFKPETYEYDIFYPGSTTVGKVQRIEKVVRYFKLHGSISWVQTERTSNNIYGIQELPIELIKVLANEDENFKYGNVMIYPSATKKSYTLDFPYSEMIRQFAACISQPQSVLFTVGYSFYDEHFNDIIYQALSNPSFTLVVVDYNGCKSAEINRLKEMKDPRIIIIEGDYLGDFLTLADEMMPNFMESATDDEVVSTLKKLLNK